MYSGLYSRWLLSCTAAVVQGGVCVNSQVIIVPSTDCTPQTRTALTAHHFGKNNNNNKNVYTESRYYSTPGEIWLSIGKQFRHPHTVKQSQVPTVVRMLSSRCQQRILFGFFFFNFPQQLLSVSVRKICLLKTRKLVFGYIFNLQAVAPILRHVLFIFVATVCQWL